MRNLSEDRNDLLNTITRDKAVSYFSNRKEKYNSHSQKNRNSSTSKIENGSYSNY